MGRLLPGDTGPRLALAWVGYGPRLVHVEEVIEPFGLAEASHYGIGLSSARPKKTSLTSIFSGMRAGPLWFVPTFTHDF